MNTRIYIYIFITKNIYIYIRTYIMLLLAYVAIYVCVGFAWLLWRDAVPAAAVVAAVVAADAAAAAIVVVVVVVVVAVVVFFAIAAFVSTAAGMRGSFLMLRNEIPFAGSSPSFLIAVFLIAVGGDIV